MGQSEHKEQMAVVKWWGDYARNAGIDERLLFAIPNGGLRTKRGAVMLKSEGVRAGIPDMFLAFPTSKFNGLFIEMKVKSGGRVSEAQTEMLSKLSIRGYDCHVCKGADAAIRVIMNYMEMEKK